MLASCPDQNRPGACSASSVETLRSRNRSRCISTRHARNIVVNQRAWSSLHRVCPLVVPSLLQAARSARLLSTDFYKNSPVEVRRCGGAAVRRWLRGVRPLNMSLCRSCSASRPSVKHLTLLASPPGYFPGLGKQLILAGLDGGVGDGRSRQRRAR